jgi:SHS family sialic acid transporter-like MFS transporter
MSETQELTRLQRCLVAATAVLSWLVAGVIMAIPPLSARQAVASMGVTEEGLRGQWFSWYVFAFLIGAALGGVGFGWIGDRFGRTKALGTSILTYALFVGACYFVTTPEQMLVLWIIACTGVGGVWPNAISLASEALPNVSRLWLAGIFGTAANFGLIFISLLAYLIPITEDHWRWVMLVPAAATPLGLIALTIVPESPVWRRRAANPQIASAVQSPAAEIFRPPLIKYTLIGILLSTVPMTGHWGAANWMVPWANQLQDEAGSNVLSAATQWTKSSGAVIGSLLGGWLAGFFGRRTAYFVVSLLSLTCSLYIFNFITPLDRSFLPLVFVQGLIGTVYFGWLPLYLPELFPTHVRATGTGMTFNGGRIATALGVMLGGYLIRLFEGDYARVGQLTCWIYAAGMVIICFAPDTSAKKIDQ